MKTLTAQVNAAINLREKAHRAAACQKYGVAAESYLKAGKPFWATGRNLEAEQMWRRACDFCERTANRIAQQPVFNA